jgi:hypothetical protein
MKVGNDIYSILKKNNIIIWSITALSIIIISYLIFMNLRIYSESRKNIYAIGNSGELIPLVQLDNKKDKVKQVKANLDYWVSLYYDLDGFTMKEKKEKAYWLLGTQPTAIMKDRDRKGYFNNFLSVSGLIQHAHIRQESWKMETIDSPYIVYFEVEICVINGETKEYYKSDVNVTVENCSKNYPYNPYGLIITKFSENLTKEEKTNTFEEEQNQQQSNNQNN